MFSATVTNTSLLRTVATHHFSSMSPAAAPVFRQLFDKESSTYTYLLACQETKEAVLIDPVIEHSERDARVVRELGLSLKYVMNTHVHADHITGTVRQKYLMIYYLQHLHHQALVD